MPFSDHSCVENNNSHTDEVILGTIIFRHNECSLQEGKTLAIRTIEENNITYFKVKMVTSDKIVFVHEDDAPNISEDE